MGLFNHGRGGEAMHLEAKTLDQIVGVIVASTTLTWDEVMAKVRDVQQELHGFVTADGAASLLAYRMNIFKDEVRDLGKIGDGAGPSPPKTEPIAVGGSCSTSLTEKQTGGIRVVDENAKILERLAEEEAKKQHGDFPADWEPKNPGDMIIGKVERIEEIEYEYKKTKKKSKVVELSTDTGKRTVWLSRTVLAKEFERKNVKVGDRIVIKFLGKPEGKTYYDYVIAVE